MGMTQKTSVTLLLETIDVQILYCFVIMFFSICHMCNVHVVRVLAT